MPESFMFIRWSRALKKKKKMRNIPSGFLLLHTLTCVCPGLLSAWSCCCEWSICLLSKASPLPWILSLSHQLLQSLSPAITPFLCLPQWFLSSSINMAHTHALMMPTLDNPSLTFPLPFSCNSIPRLLIPFPPTSVRILSPIFH